jgi:hypothetical protein
MAIVYLPSYEMFKCFMVPKYRALSEYLPGRIGSPSHVVRRHSFRLRWSQDQSLNPNSVHLDFTFFSYS